MATVSRALRGLPHVSPRTRARVERAAADLDYRANPHAARLAARRSGTIGVVLPLLNSWFYSNILAGVRRVTVRDQLDMHLVTVGTQRELEHFVTELPALAKQVDALLVVDLFLPDHLWDDLAASELPVATVGLATGRFDSVVIDNADSAERAVSHLLELGHRRIGFIGGAPGGAAELESAELRRKGMHRALHTAGIDPDPALEAAGHFTIEGGREAMEGLLSASRPSAVFCASDEMAVGAMWAAERAGLKIPDDLSVVGFDDQPVAEALELTSVHQPVADLAARAVGMMMSRLDRPTAKPAQVQVPTRFRPRRSTGAIT